MRLTVKKTVAFGLIFAAALLLTCAEDEGPVNPYIEPEPPAYIIAYLTITPRIVPPGGVAQVEVKLTDKDGNAVPNRGINLSVDEGSVESPIFTNPLGIARSTYQAPSSSLRATITARTDGAIPKKIDFQVGEGNLGASPSSILADGISTSLLTISVVDGVTPVANASVTWTVDRGSIVSADRTTDASGVAHAVFQSATSENDIDATIEATVAYGDISYTELVSIKMKGVLITVSADPPAIPADGKSTSTITVRVRETTSGDPVENATINLTTTAGEISPTAVTNSLGIATSILTSSKNAGVAFINASYGGFTAEVSVTFGSLQLSIKSSSSRIVGDGVSSGTITATLLSDSNTPIVGVPIEFSASGGIIPKSAITNSSGQAIVAFTPPVSPGEVTVVASFGNIYASLKIDIIDVDISLTTASTRVPADGFSTYQVEALLISEDGNPVVGVPVRFVTDRGSITAQSITNAYGKASAVLLSPDDPGRASIVASFADRKADTVYVDFIGLNLNLYAELRKMVADGQGKQILTAVLQSLDGTAISGGTINFTTTSGVVASHATTDANGIASVELTSTPYPSTATVKASYRDRYSDQVDVGFEIPQIALSASPPVITVGSSEAVVITALVTFSDGSPVPDNTVIRFATNLGSITTSAATSSGIASAQLVPGAKASNSVCVTASVAGAQYSTNLVFVPGNAAKIFAYATPDEVPGDGTLPATLVVEVKDSYGNYVEDGTDVDFAVVEGNGTVTSSSLTLGGIASAKYIPTGGSSFAKVRASVGSVSKDVTIKILSSLPASIVATDSAWISVAGTGMPSQVTIAARVYDANGNPVDDGTQVSFEIEHGPGGGEYIDDHDIGYGPVLKSTVGGVASVTVGSGTLPGTVVLGIQSEDAASAITRIGIASGPPDSIIVTTGAIKKGGDRCVYVLCVSAFVRDMYNNPVSDGNAVYWTIDRGDIGFIDPESYTGGAFSCSQCSGKGPKGVANACLAFTTSSMAKPYTLTARCQTIQSDFNAMIPIVEPVALALEAYPSSVAGATGGEVEILLHLKDGICDLPIAGVVVRLVVEGVGVLSNDIAITDEFGMASTILTIPATTEEETEVKAWVPFTSLSGDVKITINQ
ncbi:MAG: Ig-like domain-containing protein [bacterium]